MKKSAYFITFLFCSVTSLFGGIINQVGLYDGWDSISWTAIHSANDPDDGLAKTQLEFVGNTSNPGLYWADNGTYVFFRFRVQVATVTSTTFSDAHFLLIDVDDYLYGTGFGSDIPGRPDYGFAWDSKSNDNAAHGFEMSVFNTGANTWNGINMTDIDGSPSSKGIYDINGNGRTTDGYVRTVDGQTTDNFGTTTFIDYAVSWSYLETYTDLAHGQTWNIALASIGNATDHNNLGSSGGDIGGSASPTSSITVGWTTPLANVPEPTVMSLISISGLGLLIGRRFMPI